MDDEELAERIRQAVSHIGNKAPPPLRARRQRRPRRLVATAAAAVVIAIVAFAVVVIVDSGGQASAIGPGLLQYEPVDTDAASLLAEAAAAALDAPSPGSDDVYYTLREVWDLDIAVGETPFTDDVTLRASTEEVWTEPSRRATVAIWPGRQLEPGDVTDTYLPPRYDSEPDTTFATPDLNAGITTRVPDDPAAIITLDTLGVAADTNGDALLFEFLAGLLSQARLTPNQRAAAWNSLTTIDGLKVLGTTTDRAGRPGVAIATESRAVGLTTRLVFVFDPASGQPLAVEEVLLGDSGSLDIPTPALISYSTLIDAVYVPTVGDRP